MIDADSIAQAVFEEIDIDIQESATYHNMNIQRMREIKVEYNPLPARQTAAKVIEDAYWASLLMEEGRLCRLRLTYCDPYSQPATASAYLLDAAHLLDSPLPLDKGNLRRLSHAHDFKYGDLLWSMISGTPCIVGVRIPMYDGESFGFRMAVTSPGVLAVTWCRSRMLIFNRGEIIRKSQAGMRSFLTINALISAMLGADPRRENLVHMLIAKILEQGHGGSVWMLPDGSQLKDHLRHLSPNYALDRSPSVIDNNRHDKKSSQWIHSLARFSGVDGAVLVDAGLRALAFGVFVDTSGDHTAIKWIDSGVTLTVKGDEIGGGRHRAAVAFCAHNAPAAAIVVSQDSRVTVVGAQPGAAPQMSEVFQMNMPDMPAVWQHSDIPSAYEASRSEQSSNPVHVESPDGRGEDEKPILDAHGEPPHDRTGDRIGQESGNRGDSANSGMPDPKPIGNA